MNVDPRALAANRFIDSDHPSILAFAEVAGGAGSPAEVAARLALVVRDRLRYNPWQVSLSADGYRASEVLTRDEARGGHCIDKAMLLAAAARARGIPSRLHFADVRNHLGTARLEQILGTHRLVYHGYVELFLGGAWIAATPAFDRRTCERLGVEPLTFDGVNPSVFQAYDAKAGLFMETIEDHGTFYDVPVDAMVAAWRRHYPAVRDGAWPQPSRVG